MKNVSRGFSLIELMMVVAIISILVLAGMVFSSAGREKSKVTAFKTQANSVRTKAILACDSLTTLTYSSLLSSLGVLPDGISVSQHVGGAALNCGASSGYGVFDIDITTSTVDCSMRATNDDSSTHFFGTAQSC